MRRYLEAAALVLAGAVSAIVFTHFMLGDRAVKPEPQQVAVVPHPEPMPMTAPVPVDLPQATPANAVPPVKETPLGDPASAPAPVAAVRPRPVPSPSSAHRSPSRPARPNPAPIQAPAKPIEPAATAPPVETKPDPGMAPVVSIPPATAPPANAPVVTPPEPVAPAPAPPRKVTLTAGMVLPVRLNESVGSDRNQTGDTFTGVLESELVADGMVIAERGARVEGRVVQSQEAGKVKGVSSIAIELTQIVTSDGQRVRIETDTFEKKGSSSAGEDAVKVGTGAAIGAAIGAIAGGGKGAAIGAAIGGATGTGGVLMSRGKAVTLPAETRIPFRLRNAVTITEKKG